MEFIFKCKACNLHELDVGVSQAVTHQHGLKVDAHSFAGIFFDGHIPGIQSKQITNRRQNLGARQRQEAVDPDSQSADAGSPGARPIHLGKSKSLNVHDKWLLNRRQTIELLISRLKADCRINRY